MAYHAEHIHAGIPRTQANALFTQLAMGYVLCHDRTHAEAVIIERLSAYRFVDAPDAARIPLAGCDFTGEIGNIIVALSNRCAQAEQQRDEAHRTIRELTARAKELANDCRGVG